MENFIEECIKHIMETILVIQQGIDTIDKGQNAKAGALLGSQVHILTHFLQANNNDPVISKMAKELKKESKNFLKKITKELSTLKEKQESDLRYLG